MTISLNERISFTSNPAPQARNRDKDAEKKIVAGGGAIAAKSGFDMFASASKVSKGMKGVAGVAKTTTAVTKQTTGLWAKVVENAKWAKDAVLNWGAKVKGMKVLKPLVNSKLYKFGAGFFGYGFGFVTLISGLSDISKVATDAIDENILHKN